MTQSLITVTLWLSAIGCGLIGGIYFAFSAFIMTALSGIAPSSAVAAMNAINAIILRSLFMPVFLATTLGALVLAIVGIIRWGQPDALAMAAGGIIYVIGMAGVTMAFNVPLNTALSAAAPASAEALWARYLSEWTLWNHVRTLASVAASALFVYALTAK